MTGFGNVNLKTILSWSTKSGYVYSGYVLLPLVKRNLNTLEMELLLYKLNRMCNHEYMTEIKCGRDDSGVVPLNLPLCTCYSQYLPMSTTFFSLLIPSKRSDFLVML